MQVPYLRMHGTGNLILVVDQRSTKLAPPTANVIRKLADAASGPGFDQMLWVSPATDDACVASYRVFNSDGSEVEQCGNGILCVARLLASEDDHAQEFVLQSPAGHVAARIEPDGRVAVSMGTPVFEPCQIPFDASEAGIIYPLDVQGENIDVSVVSMGNPHCVVQVADVASAPLGDLGPAIEHHERFPQLTNVEFMTVIDQHTIDLRVHERGVGETRACGTGACAAVVAGQRLGLLQQHVNVRLPGGQVMVSWRGGDDLVWLSGNAVLISEGMMELED